MAFLVGYGPHVQRQAASFASDVFALAVTLNECLTRTVPYTDMQQTDVQLHTVIETS
eukprot:CAMPEP_0185787344 /NCGR_PEP_ID=MMETSP1174-20130828/140078_1 /TAXON_ID=35687 /ORGANISM="Dictyocha speculum, Strain CCMP1381" /LENGTH=56 /DNA_ID=CAMNT_0028480455 /DNA_START=24 /DNA_END=191 /DNA_ORIENTATION=+